MNKPRIFLGSSGKQAKLLQAITRGLEDAADVEPWTATFGGGPPSTGSSILHAHGSKLPARPAAGPAEVRAINQKLRKAIETEGRRGQVEGLWWQLSLTMRSEDEPSAVSLLRIARDRDVT